MTVENYRDDPVCPCCGDPFDDSLTDVDDPRYTTEVCPRCEDERAAMSSQIPGRSTPTDLRDLSGMGALRHDGSTVVHFVQPDKLLNMNDRQHWSARARTVSNWREYARHAAGKLDRSPAKRAHGPSVVEVRLPVRDRRRRDPSNYAPTMKAIVDGLTDAGFWPDDDSQWVATLEPVLVVRRDRLVVVSLEPMERRNR